MESPGKDYLVGGGESNDVGRAFNHRNEQEHEHKQQHYNSQPLTGDGASPGKIFTGGLARETTIAQFIKHFGKYCEITDSVIMKDRKTGQPHGFGFITFADPLVVDKVIEDPHVIIGKQMNLETFSHAMEKSNLEIYVVSLKNDILSNSIQTRSKAHQIIKRMLVSLGDPYTREVTEDNGDHRLKVLGLILDGPTYSAGVRQEDEILVVNNMEVKGKSTFEVSSLLQGPNGTSITIQVKRGNRGPVESIEVQRQFVARTPVSYRMEQDESGAARVGYIRLKEFNALARKDLVIAMKRLQDMGASYFVLDLRDNLGGLVQAGIEIAKLFLHEGDTVNNSSLQNRLVRRRLPPLINTTHVISLSNVGLNPPLQTQYNEGVGGCNEGKPNAAIKATRGGPQLRRKVQQLLCLKM